MKNLYQWGFTTNPTIENPKVETLQHFLDRKSSQTGFQNTEEWAIGFLSNYKERTAGFDYFIGTPEEFAQYKIDLPIQQKADKGLLADDIVLLYLSLVELLTNYINWLPYSALAEKQRFKIIIETLIKYNLELVNKDYDPNFTISNRDKGVLITALTKVKEEYPEHFALMAKPFKLEAEATPDEVWTAYEKQMEILHRPVIDPNTAPGGSETLAGQLPTDAGGTQGGA